MKTFSTFGEIVFWLIIIILVSTGIILLFNPFTEYSAYIILFIIIMIIGIWLLREIYSIKGKLDKEVIKLDKKTEKSFTKLKNDIENRLDKIIKK